MLPLPIGYHGSLIESCPKQTLIPFSHIDHRPHHARGNAADEAKNDDDCISRRETDDDIGGRELNQQHHQQRFAVECEGGTDQWNGGNGGGQRINTDQKTNLAFFDAQPLGHLWQNA